MINHDNLEKIMQFCTPYYIVPFKCQRKLWHCKNLHFKSNQIKSLLLSHHHSTSALVSEILESVLQTVQKKQNKKQFTYRQYIFTDCTEDNVQNTHTYTQYTQCTIKTYLVTNTPYVHILHYVHIFSLRILTKVKMHYNICRFLVTSEIGGLSCFKSDKRCKSRAVKIIKDSNHPSNCLFTLLSGKRFRSLMAKTERLRRSFFPQAIRLLNSNSAS